MQLVLITHRRRAAFKIAHVAVIIGHDERALKLARVTCVNTEVTAQLHRTAHTLGDVHKRTVTEHSGVEGSREVVTVRHHTAQVLAHKVRMLLYGLTYRREDDSLLGQLLFERGLHRH